MRELNLLFVCSGNTCRSPMAEAYAAFAYSNDKRYKLNVRSAGLYAFGDRINPNSENALREFGIRSVYPHDYKSHISHTVNIEDLEWAHYVICVNGEIGLRLAVAAPEYKSRITAFKNGVGDPYGGSEDEYILCLKEIAYQADLLIPSLIKDFLCKDIIYKCEDFTNEEIDQLSACEKAHFCDAGSAESLKTMLDDRAFAVAAFDGGKLCGFGYIYVAPGEAELLRIAVDREYRSLGIAKNILSRLHKKAEDELCEKIFLEVRRSNTGAIRLYEAMGYKQIGVRKGFYRDPKEDALLYAADLNKK